MALPKQPTTETMSEAVYREEFDAVLQRVQKDDDRVIIEKDGAPVA